MDFVQELAWNVGHMATRRCSRCKGDKICAEYHGSQWKLRYRVCNGCKEREKQQTIAAGSEPLSSPAGQHGAHTSAAAASAGAVGESVAASLPGGGMMPGGGGGASVPSAFSGPCTRGHVHGMPVGFDVVSCSRALLFVFSFSFSLSLSLARSPFRSPYVCEPSLLSLCMCEASP